MVRPKDGMARPMPRTGEFVGRAAPLTLLLRWLDEALHGQPCAVFVEGDAGIGKSRLVAEVLSSAQRRGAVVLVGRCSEDLSIPYLPITQAIAPLGDELGAASQLVAPTASAPEDPTAVPDPRPAAPLVAACRSVVRAARRRPVVLLIEDLHWADRHTTELFQQLATSALDAGLSTAVLVVATLRPPSGHVASVVERLRRESRVRSVRLDGMSEFELNDLLTSLAPARPSRSLLADFVSATNGNPLLARSILHRLLQSHDLEVRDGELSAAAGSVQLPVAGDLDGELRRHLDQIGGPCRSVLVRAALLGYEGLLSDLEAVASVPPDRFDDLLEEAETAGVLQDDGERYRFDHPHLRELLYHEPGGRRRQRLHCELADQLQRRYGTDPRRATEIADHLRLGGPTVERARLSAFCRAAGDQAFAVGAWGAAGRYLDAALDADPPDDARERARVSLRAGLCHFRDHDLPLTEKRLISSIADARAADDIDVWGVAAQLLTRARLTIGPRSVGAGVETAVLQELLAATGPDAKLRGEIVGLLAEARFHAFDVEGGLPLLDEARRLANQNGDDGLATSVELAAGLQYLGRLELAAAESAFRASALHAQRLSDPWQRVWGVGRLPLVEIMRGELRAADDHADEAVAIASANHDWAEHALASACATQVAAARSESAGAETAAAVALQMYRRSDYAFVPPLVYPSLAAVRSARGDLAGAHEALDDWVLLGGSGLTPLRLLAAACAGDRAWLAEAPPFRPLGNRPVNLFSLLALCAQVEVAAALDDVDLLADAYEPIAASFRVGVRWCVGWPLLLARLLAVASRGLGRFAQAEEWCELAAAQAASAGAMGELARVTLERARIAAARGDATGAQTMASDAAATFDRLGMLPLRQAALELGGGGRGEGLVRTILFTDLVGSTAMNIRRGDAAYLELLRRHNRILRNRLRRFDGVELKHTGDGIAAWFSSAATACECALAIRDDVAEHNVNEPDAAFLVRLGLASGSPIAHEGDLFGVAVSLAARLCDHAAPGQVLVAEEVATAADGGRVTFRAVDRLDLKGFPEPVAAFAAGLRSA